MKPRTENLRWSGFIVAFDEGPHYDGWLDGHRVARVFACRKLAGLDVPPYPSGRRRRLYLALADVGRTWGLIGVCETRRGLGTVASMGRASL